MSMLQFSKLFSLLKLDKKSTRLYKHIGLASVYKGGSIIIGIILVPLSIQFLGNELYGLWLTIFSFLGWFSIVDFGIGNGLRNRLTEALSTENSDLAKRYVSTAYVLMSIISLIVMLVFSIVYPFVNWHVIFGYNIENESVNRLILAGFILFSFNLTLKNIVVLYYADQRSSFPELFQFLSQLISLIGILFLMTLSGHNIFIYGTLILGSQLIVLTIASIISFFGKYESIRPSFKFYDRNRINDIFSLGVKFFIIQISATLLYTTDNYIINIFLGSSEVTVFNIPYKYFMLVISVITIISTPYWSAFTQAFHLKDMTWMKDSMNKLKKMSLFMGIITVLMILFSDVIFKMWVGDLVEVPFSLTLIMGLNIILRIFLYPVIMFINGTGKIKIELYLGIVLSLINIPLSIFFAKYLEYGVTGVILATLLLGLVEIIVYPIQVFKILNSSAKGIWNA